MTEAKTSRLEKLKARHAKLAADIAKAEAAERKAERAKDTRRKILIGAAILSELEERKTLRPMLSGILDRRLTQERDRALFPDLLAEAEAESATEEEGSRETV